MELPVMPPVRPMLAKAVTGLDQLPDEELQFEPKWDGFRCIVFRHDAEIVLGSRNDRPLTRYFPEILAPLLDQLPARCVVDGELIVAVGGRLDFDALQQRIHPAESRVRRLAEETPSSYVAFDLLAVGDDDATGWPLTERRGRLEELLAAAAPPVHLCPASRSRERAQDWFERFEGAGLDGLLAKPLAGRYVQDRRVQWKVKHRRTADCVVAGFRWHKDGQGVGSLLLGLYDDAGELHHAGVAASFSAKDRSALVARLAPFREGLEEHPWAQWAELSRASDTTMPGGWSRWNAKKDLSFEPLRPELVCEVDYGGLQQGRFRATTKLVRWRPDRTPESCRFDQLVIAPPAPLDEVLAAQG